MFTKYYKKDGLRRSPKKLGKLYFIGLIMIFMSHHIFAQMRQIYVDNDPMTIVLKMSFYSPSEGFVAFRYSIGYTNDSGRTFTQKFITSGNVNFNGYNPDLTYGFGILGMKAFNQNNIIVYGGYANVPAILYSTDGGNSFTLVYYSQYDPLYIKTGITDMLFPLNNNVGYAVDADRILKTTNQGLTWTTVRIEQNSFFSNIEALDNNNVFAQGTFNLQAKLIKTIDGGTNWQIITPPILVSGQITYSHFLSTDIGWISMIDNLNKQYFFKTINGGVNWTLQNNTEATPFSCSKMKFFDDNTGYALAEKFTVYKTLNSGATWEPLPKDNNYGYSNYTHFDLQFISATQLWAGGGHGFLELSTNGGGNPLPKAYFRIDTTSIYSSNNVNLLNYSRSGYQYKWYVNKVLVSTNYNTSYIHDVYHPIDTIKLVVINGSFSDSAIKYQYCGPIPKPVITSYSPNNAGPGATVLISGSYLLTTSSVRFGSFPAASFSVVSGNTVNAVVGIGSSGKVYITTTGGTDSIPGFTFNYPPPTINSFNPSSATAGSVINITGNFFNNATGVSFGGIPASSFTVVSSTQINAVVGSGNTGNVTVTTPVGSSTLGGFTFIPQLTINSFSPASGPIGTTVTINGANFSSIPSNNIVYFGAVSANVLTATATTITVTVPAGASHLPLTVTTGNQIASSLHPFMPTFNGGGLINVNSFQNVGTYATTIGGQSINYGCSGDIDKDGKTDIVTSNVTNLSSISVFRNTSTISNISFAARQDIHGIYNEAILLRDMNGDGWLDLIARDYPIQIFKNISSVGNIAFDVPISFGGIGRGTGLAIADIDGDGRLDMAAPNSSSPFRVAVYRNTSTNGILSFDPLLEYPAGDSPKGIELADLDGDNKPEMIFTNYYDNNIYVYKNISIKGKIDFAPAVNFPFGARGLAAGDLDGDGKIDLAVSFDTKVTVLINTSTGPGNFSFSPIICPVSGGWTVQIADLNGDAKADLISANASFQTVSIIQNTGTAGNISFASKVEYTTGNTAYPQASLVGDLDGDGKSDLVYFNSYQASVTIFRNRVNEVYFAGAGRDTTICPGKPVQLGIAAVPGSLYSWTSNPAGFTSSLAKPIVTPLVTTSYFLTVQNSAGYTAKDTVIVVVVPNLGPNIWTGTSSIFWDNPNNWSLGIVPNACSDIIINSGTVRVGSNVTIRSLTINPGVNFIINPGYNLTIIP